MMKILTEYEAFQELCKEKKMWGLHIHFDSEYYDFDQGDFLEDLFSDAPYLKDKEFEVVRVYQCADILFDTKEEVMKYFNDTKLKDGEVGVYALVISPAGDIVTENA